MDANPADARLRAVQAQFDPISRGLLSDLGLASGWRCWEVGAGHGSLVNWLAGVVGPGGAVLATDIEPASLVGTFPGWVRIERHDVTTDPAPQGQFDLIHARFLLEHLPDPAATIASLAANLAPGGRLAVEDNADLLFASDPEEPELAVLAPPWEAAGRDVGWNARYGQQLLRALRAAHIGEVAGRSWRIHAPGGRRWDGAVIGITHLEQRILEHGASPHTIATARRCLTDRANLITGAAVVSAWAHKLDDGDADGC